MDNEQIKQKVISAFPSAEFSEEGSEYLNITVTSEHLHSIGEFLKKDPDLLFDYLFCLTGIDWVTHFIIAYHLTSSVYNHPIVLKVKITDRENPLVDTVCDIWKTAEFHEREVYDLLGIKFKDHPDLRRIFLEDDWVGYPLRKDYVDEANIVEL